MSTDIDLDRPITREGYDEIGSTSMSFGWMNRLGRQWKFEALRFT